MYASRGRRLIGENIQAVVQRAGFDARLFGDVTVGNGSYYSSLSSFTSDLV